MIPLLVSSGEPAGIGPDICLSLAQSEHPLVVLGDINLLKERAVRLRLDLKIREYQPNTAYTPTTNELTVFHIPVNKPVIPGVLNKENASYVLKLLETGAALCATKQFSGLVTAPVSKSVINEAGYSFTGHTEFFESYFQVEKVVMMLACQHLRVALITTHLPLKDVSKAITIPLIKAVIRQLHQSLVTDFAISSPYIKVAGLNPHAGESGHLGMEEIEVISPALEDLKLEGMRLEGPLPADTMFIPQEPKPDAYVAMYHDQGLPIMKYLGFYDGVNITLGLPIIRTSVDHGTALDLAGTGAADPRSMQAAVAMAQLISKNRFGT